MLIVLTSPDKIANESELLNQLFAEGLETLHLRKPTWTKPEFESLLKSIDPEHKRKVVLHQFHELASKYNIKGLHLREENRLNISLSELKNLRKEMKRKNLTLSSSFHSKEEIEKFEGVFDYVFLSPVFDSISKPDYLRNDELGMMSDEWKSLVKTKIIALGGIDASNISKTKEMGFDGAAVLGAVWGVIDSVERFIKVRKSFTLSNTLYFESFTTLEGNIVEVANTHVGQERSKNLSIAFFLVDKGYKVRLLHNNITNKELFKIIMPVGSKYPKHADALVNAELFEFKTNISGTIKSLKNDIKAAGRQANKILVRFETEGFTNKTILRGITGEMLAFKHIESVWIMNKNNLLKFERKYVIKKNP